MIPHEYQPPSMEVELARDFASIRLAELAANKFISPATIRSLGAYLDVFFTGSEVNSVNRLLLAREHLRQVGAPDYARSHAIRAGELIACDAFRAARLLGRAEPMDTAA